jgi:hypothetical protein
MPRCAVQKAICALIWTALAEPDFLGDPVEPTSLARLSVKESRRRRPVWSNVHEIRGSVLGELELHANAEERSMESRLQLPVCLAHVGAVENPVSIFR